MVNVQAGVARPTACAREAIAHLGTELALDHGVRFVPLRIAARKANGERIELLVWAGFAQRVVQRGCVAFSEVRVTKAIRSLL
jgi:hypothetical protein